MTKNPLYNALLASAYIVIIILLIFFAPSIFKTQEDNILIPMGMLSLFVLSAAIMAYLFFYQPVMLFLNGEREKAIKLFLYTVGIFAALTILIFIISVIVARL